VHSTALWHLKQGPRLDALAALCFGIDRTSPIALVVAANAASLRGEHREALAYLSKSTALAPRYVYAHNLAGHEHLATGDAERARTCFRTALRHDPRHYNALFGYGCAYLREERPALAEAYFRRALSINAASAVMHTYLATALNTQGRHSDALACLAKALQLSPGLPQALYQRAQVHLAAGDLPAAEAALLAVYEAAPREPTVLVQLGKVCKSLDKKAEAVSGSAVQRCWGQQCGRLPAASASAIATDMC
jgi:anaphase-promoting complex subunit 3